MASQFRIKVIKDGPYLVTGGIPLVEEIIVTDAEGHSHGWCTGKKYPAQENYALCRCGQSKNTPFCDGTHLEVEFDGTETASRETYLNQAERLVGPTLELTDAQKLCASARFCHRAGGTWNLTQASSTPEAKRTAIEEAGDCPSGRLVVWDKNGKAIEPECEPSIGLVQDPRAGVSGPLCVHGGIAIESADGITYEVRHRVTLCRCGKSRNKPFCDGTHISAKFSDGSEALRTIPST